jgi:cytochrome c biogenesis protein CcmG/thiol:disulfide interchange protein DsbE
MEATKDEGRGTNRGPSSLVVRRAETGTAAPFRAARARSTAPGGATGDRRLAVTRLGLAGVSVVAVAVFATYAAFLAARADEVDAPVPIVVPSQGATTPVGAGQRAPDFALATLDGQTVTLSAFAGRPVWVNVWASWCAPCRAEMPDISAVYQELRARDAGGDLVLLLVSLGEEPPVVRRYLESTRYHLPVLVDPGFAITERYRITGLPTHYFIGRDGTIKDLAIGGLKPNGMRARLAKILA